MKLGQTTKPKSTLAKTGLVVVFLIAALASALIVQSVLKQDSGDNKSTGKNILNSTNKEEYVSTEHKFKATYPGFPTTERQNVSVSGYDITQTVYGKQTGDNYFGVAVADYPAEFDMSDTKSALQGALNGSAQNTNGKVTASSFTKFGSHDAIDGTIEGTESGRPVTTRIRNILVGQRLYTIISVNASESDFQSFRDSFQLQ